MESDLSDQHCSKLFLKSPSGLNIIGGIKSNQLSWNNIVGAFEYNIYKKLDNDSTLFIDKVKASTFTDRDLGYDEEHCYVISAIDAEGDESGFSKVFCGRTNSPPNLEINNYSLIEVSGDKYLYSKDQAKL